MNKEHVKGAIDNAVGKTKEAVGHAVGSKRLETKGKVDQAKGAAHNAAGDVRDAGRKVVDRVTTKH
jgi:uncharacterized protein YjbJ (UPF0337 family)